MSLREKLSEIRKKGEAKRDPATTAKMHQVTQELRDSGIVDRVLKVGSKAPPFMLPDAYDRIVSSAELLARGPLAVAFYRGHW